jgi:hypothetical protein
MENGAQLPVETKRLLLQMAIEIKSVKLRLKSNDTIWVELLPYLMERNRQANKSLSHIQRPTSQFG